MTNYSVVIPRREHPAADQRRICVRVVLAVLLLVAVGGCGNEPGPGDSGAGGGAALLTGRTFLSTGVVGRDLVAGTRIRLSFDPRGTIGANAGCNHLGGELRIDGDVLVVHEMGGTEMGCDPPRHAQDEWLTGFLMSSPSFTLAGDTLELTSGTTVMTLVDREVAEPDRPLEGTRWTADTIIDGDVASSIPAAAEAFFAIAPEGDGSVRGADGCNEFVGTAEIAGSQVTFSVQPSTARECTGDVVRLVTAMQHVLEGARFEIDASRLTLTARDGAGVSFVADP